MSKLMRSEGWYTVISTIDGTPLSFDEVRSVIQEVAPVAVFYRYGNTAILGGHVMAKDLNKAYNIRRTCNTRELPFPADDTTLFEFLPSVHPVTEEVEWGGSLIDQG